MGFRFSKRMRLGSFARINLSKSGASLSPDGRDAHLTIGRTPRVTVGIPGSGLSWTETLPRGRRQAAGVAGFIGRAIGLLIGAAIGLGIWTMASAERDSA